MNFISWWLTYWFRRLLCELSFRREIKKVRQLGKWAPFFEPPIRITYALQKGFL